MFSDYQSEPRIKAVPATCEVCKFSVWHEAPKVGHILKCHNYAKHPVSKYVNISHLCVYFEAYSSAREGV